MSDPSVTYRDATISKSVRDDLYAILWSDHMRAVTDEVGTRAVFALCAVIERWDANEATEMVVDRDGAPA